MLKQTIAQLEEERQQKPEEPAKNEESAMLQTSENYVKTLEAKVADLQQQLHEAKIRADPGDISKFSELLNKLERATTLVHEGRPFSVPLRSDSNSEPLYDTVVERIPTEQKDALIRVCRDEL